jgi:DNA repair photolyase
MICSLQSSTHAVFWDMVDEIPLPMHNGRGAVGNPTGRFEPFDRCPVDDGWKRALLEDEGLAQKLKTTLHIDTSRTVINKIDSPDLPYMRSINPYRGCEHGCIYCFARPSHSYLGYSAGLDFETEIFYKPDAPEILRRELASRHYKPEPITLGSNTDCYQPVERTLKLTRRILEVLHEHHHPLTIITKSALVVRDIDLLAPMAKRDLVHVCVSVTTLEPSLARAMEPRAAAPQRRLDTIRALSEAGIPVTVMAAPMIPALNDMEMEQILDAAYDAGAQSARYTMIRLPYELKDLFREWLQTHRPQRAEHVLSLIRQTRGGKLYDADYSQRGRGTGAYADLMAARFKQARKKFRRGEVALRSDLFQVPPVHGQIVFAFD